MPDLGNGCFIDTSSAPDPYSTLCPKLAGEPGDDEDGRRFFPSPPEQKTRLGP